MIVRDMNLVIFISINLYEMKYGAWEVKLEIMTDRPSDRQGHREVLLPIRLKTVSIIDNRNLLC